MMDRIVFYFDWVVQDVWVSRLDFQTVAILFEVGIFRFLLSVISIKIPDISFKYLYLFVVRYHWFTDANFFPFFQYYPLDCKKKFTSKK